MSSMDIEKIDPELRRVYRLTPPIPVHRAWTLPVIRKLIDLSGRSKAPDDVTITDHEIGDAAVRVYRPSSPTTDAAILWMHGGGYVIGTARMDDRRCVRYASTFGVVVVSVDYRLAPEHPFPAPLDDCLAGWDWMHESADDLGIDPAKIVVGGESAGGGLAATLVQRIRDRPGPQPAAQLLVYPMLDDRTAADTSLDALGHRMWNNRANRAGWSAYLGHAPGADDVAPYGAGSRRADLAGLPPTWIGVGDVDLFFAEDEAYAERLEAAGVDCDFVAVPGAPHGFTAVGAKTTIAKDFEASANAFLSRHLAG